MRCSFHRAWRYRSVLGVSFTLESRKDLTDEFKQKMLCDNPVRYYRFTEADFAAARKAKAH